MPEHRNRGGPARERWAPSSSLVRALLPHSPRYIPVATIQPRRVPSAGIAHTPVREVHAQRLLSKPIGHLQAHPKETPRKTSSPRDAHHPLASSAPGMRIQAHHSLDLHSGHPKLVEKSSVEPTFRNSSDNQEVGQDSESPRQKYTVLGLSSFSE